MFVWIARSATSQAVAPIPGELGDHYEVGAGNSGPAKTRDAAALTFAGSDASTRRVSNGTPASAKRSATR